MAQNLFLLSSKIKMLREKKNLTQADLARELGLTRSSINAWEMGLSVPSTNYIVELSKLFNVSSDYLLGLDETATLQVSGLTPKQVTVLTELIECLKK
jgi:transcriptional regulator with XRE-family HTH domain